MTKKCTVLLFIALLCGISAYAAPVEGKTFTNVDHAGAYPTPQNVTAELSDDGRTITLHWDGVHWPVDGYPEEIDGRTVPTNFYYVLERRQKASGTTQWEEWRERYSAVDRYEFNYGVRGEFLERVTLKLNEDAGYSYQYRVKCTCNPVWRNPNGYRDPVDDPDPTQDCYFSEWSEVVQAYRVLDNLEVASAQTGGELKGKTTVTVGYTYKSSREKEGDELLYFTYKAIEIPAPEPGTTPEQPAEGEQTLRTAGRNAAHGAKPDGTSKAIDPSNFALKASDKSGIIIWDAYKDLKNYHHDDVTIWVQGWAQPETEGGEPRLVLDEAIGKVALDTRPVAAEPTADKTGVFLTWPNVPKAVKYEVWRTGDTGENILWAESTDTTYTDMRAEEAEVYTYKIKAFNSANNAIDSGYVSGYRTQEKIEFVQARQLYPWTRQVAIDIYYKSARQSSTDGELTYGIKAQMADGTEVPIAAENLYLETINGAPLTPNDIPFGSKGLPSGATTRIWWNAPADLGTVQLPSSVISGIVLQLVPTLAEGAPAGAAPAPAAVASVGFTVDLRTVRTVAPGEQIPVVWEWWRTDKRDATKDYTLIYTRPEGSDTDEDEVLKPETNNGEGTIEVPDNEYLWPSFRLVKYEKNDDTSEAQQITLTSEVLFQMPVVAPQNVQATRGNADAVTVTWDAVPHAYHYLVEITTINERGAKTMTTQYAFDTRYIDQRAPELGIVGYKVQACFPNNVTSEQSEQVVGWRSIDKAELKGVSTRRPWNGRVDIDLTYQTMRNQFVQLTGTNLPDRKVTIAVKTADGEAFAVQSLIKETLEKSAGMIWREQVDGRSPFVLGNADRITWDAPADAPRMYEPNAVMTITLQSDEYSEEIKFERTFDLDTRTGVIEVLSSEAKSIPIPWSTRWAKPEATQLGFGENDAWWKQTAVLTDVTDNENPKEILRTEARLGEGTVNTWTPKKWGLNTLTLILRPVSGSNEQTEYFVIFNVIPDFTFTATQGNRDSIVVEWNELRNIHTYSIRRRAAHTNDDFVEVAICTDTTRWADTSAETVVGEFEYTIMPLKDGTDTWTQFNPVVGYRALDIQRPITIVSNVAGVVTTDKETARYGETVTLTIASAAGYILEQYSVTDGEMPLTLVPAAEDGTFTFIMPAGEVVVTVAFKAIDYDITIVPSVSGTVTPDKTTAHIGETVTLIVTPDKGYELDAIHVMNGTTQVAVTLAKEGKYTFVMPAGDVVISTLFKETTGTGVNDATAVDALPRKVLRDGQVYILRDGKTYTATGIEVK